MNRSFLRAAISAALLSLSLGATSQVVAHEHKQEKKMSQGQKMEMASDAVTLGDLEISSGFARATLPTAPVGGGYLTIKNNGQKDDTLISATSDVAGEVQLHNMRVVDDVMKMYEMEGGIPLPAGETVTLAPGGLHIMFMQLNQPLVEGTQVSVKLTFENAGTIDVVLDVRKIAAMGKMTHKGMKNDK